MMPFNLASGFKLSILQLQNAIHFSFITLQKKSCFTIFGIQNCAKHKKTCECHLYCWDHVCKVNEQCLVDYFHSKFRVSTPIKVCDYCIAKCKFSTYGGLLMALQAIFLLIKIFMLIRTLRIFQVLFEQILPTGTLYFKKKIYSSTQEDLFKLSIVQLSEVIQHESNVSDFTTE